MKLKTLILAAALAVASSFAIAGTAMAETQTQATVLDTSGLTPEKIAELQKQIDAAKSTADRTLDTANRVMDMADPAKLSEWAEFGKNIGSSIAQAAKEIGVAAKDFANTPLGMTAVGVIVFKIFQPEIAGIFEVGIGLLLLFVAFRTWNFYFKKLCMTERTVVTVTEVPQLDAEGNETGIMSKETRNEVIPLKLDDGAVAVTRLLMFVALIILCIPGLVWIA